MTQAYARPPAAGRAIRRSVLAAVVLAALAAPAAWAQAQAAEPIAALIEEFGPIFDRHDGTVRWTSEMQSPGAGEPPEPAVRADVAFPERGLTLSWVLRRNADRALPASHTIEIMFKLPADFAYGGIAQVPAMAAKSAENARGVPLAALAVKVTDLFFMMGLSELPSERERNIQLLKQWPWFDLLLTYRDGRHARIAMQKGESGERALADAFKAWGQ